MRKLLRLLLAAFVLFDAAIALAQERPVSGTVLSDDDNAPLLGVTVTNRNTDKKTQTNTAGYFTIPAAKGHVLVLTYVGYARREFVVGDDNTISLRMTPADKTEQVVTVYGQRQSKRALGYSAQDVKGDDLAQTRRENFINALAGRVAGVNITPTSGVPGASTSIVLRGATSLGGNNQPLFVVDGVPYDNQTMNQENLASGNTISLGNRSSDYGNRAGDINPEDIESVTVLKGPEATALYGSDGASGAIIITTKKGKAGKATVTYNTSFRWEKVYRFPEVQKTYMRGTNGVANPLAFVNPFAGGELYAYFGPKYPEGTKFYDNFDAFFKTGFTQNHNLSIDGGTDVATYRFSANYVNQDGIVPNTGFERLSLRVGANAKLSPKLSVNGSMNYITSQTDKAPKGVGSYFLSLLNFPIDVDASDYITPDGTRKSIRNTSTESDNPFWDVNKNTAKDKLDRLTANFTFNYDPAKWLNLSLITGIDVYSQTGDYVVHPQSRFARTVQGFYSLYQQNTRNISNIGKITFKKTWGDFANTFIVGFSSDNNRTTIQGQRGETFFEPNFVGINNTAPTSQLAKTNAVRYRKARVFGNYNLGFRSMVYISLSGSREGNSTLKSALVNNNSSYNFGAASFSVILTELKALNELEWLSYAKARISYGTTGKGPVLANITDPTFQPQITTGGGMAYGVTGNNSNIRPEFTKNFEFGGELKLFDNRISIDVTRYSLRSKDQILAARSSYGTGFVIKWFNGGLIENKGLEAIVNINAVKRKDFNWDITVNFDRNRGKILQMPKDLPTYYDSDTWVFGNLRSQAYKGATTGNLSGFAPAKNSAGQIIINPTSGFPSTNSEFVIAGDRQPDFKVGLINNFTYKNFNLSFNLDFRKGGDVFNGNEYFLYLTGLSTRTLDRERTLTITGVLNDGLQNTDKPTPNTIAITPYYRSDFYGTTVATEADFIESVNWMRLRDATLAYNFPRAWLQGQKLIKSASVYVTGTDLFMVTNYSGADPSVNANTAFSRGYGGAGIDYGSLATPRGINIGFKAQF